MLNDAEISRWMDDWQDRLYDICPERGKGGGGKVKGLFIPGITAEKFRSGCLELIENLMLEDEIFNIDYDPRYIPAIRDKLWEIQQCSNCILKPEKKIVEIKSQWIPVTEGMPKKYKRVFVSVAGEISTNFTEVDFVTDNNMWFFHKNRVTAWMPVPEPYELEVSE